MTVRCCGCHLPIADRFLLKVIDRPWHQDCLRCATCRRVLSDKCFRRHGQLYCPDDFYRRFGTKCVNCCHGFAPDDLVREASGRLFHVECFSCIVCGKRIETGQEFLVIDDATILCKEDCILHGRMVTGKLEACHRTSVAMESTGTSFRTDQQRTSLTTDQQESSPATDQQGSSLTTDYAKGTSVETDSQGTSAVNQDSLGASVEPEAQRTPIKIDSGSEDCETSDSEADLDAPARTEPDVALGDREGPGNLTKRRGPRTTIRVQQLELLKQAFARNPKPMAMEREQLRQLTGLDIRVIQVWFQNRRSKERRRKLLNSVSSYRHLLYGSNGCHWPTAPPLLPFDLSDGESGICEPGIEPERSFLYYDGRTLGNSHSFLFRGNSMQRYFDPKKLPRTSSTRDIIDCFPASVASLEIPPVARDAADGDAASWTSL